MAVTVWKWINHMLGRHRMQNEMLFAWHTATSCRVSAAVKVIIQSCNTTVYNHVQPCNTGMWYIHLQSAVYGIPLATCHQSRQTLTRVRIHSPETCRQANNQERQTWIKQAWAGQQLTCWSAHRFPEEPRPPACDARLAPQRQTSLQHNIIVRSAPNHFTGFSEIKIAWVHWRTCLLQKWQACNIKSQHGQQPAANQFWWSCRAQQTRLQRKPECVTAANKFASKELQCDQPPAADLSCWQKTAQLRRSSECNPRTHFDAQSVCGA